jgi:hypothetical protein
MVYIALTIVALSVATFFDLISTRTAFGLFFLGQFIPGIIYTYFLMHRMAPYAEIAQSWGEWLAAALPVLVGLFLSLGFLALAIWLLIS